jgi:cytochrome P450 family 2 subfamily U polypeptide 1
MLPFYLPDSSKPGQKKLLDFLLKAIKEHRETIQVGSPRDFIDVFLEDRFNKTGSQAKSDADDIDLAYTLYDLFGAGSDTTSTTLSWALFLLASRPEVQEKLYQEITSLAGGSRAVALDDRVKMPYTEAVMLEVHRMASLAPIGVPHATTEDVEFKGFKIPKNTMIFANLFAVHFSKATWGDPHNFRPERFLSDDGKTFNRHPNVLAFSVGKRQCLGETTAKDEFFLFLTNIIQQLKVAFPCDEPKHTLEGQRGLVLTPIPHRIILTSRH